MSQDSELALAAAIAAFNQTAKALIATMTEAAKVNVEAMRAANALLSHLTEAHGA